MFLWRDSSETAKRWVVQISFADHTPGFSVAALGEPMQLGRIDPTVGSSAELTPQQLDTRTWTPDAETWDKIKKLSVKSPATIQITGYAEGESTTPISTGEVTISTSVDPVGAPVFYRDVPLRARPSGEKGTIEPLPASALPLIKWELRYVGEPQSKTMMENLPTCANCHSFTADGKTLALDMDGPQNDKGLYAIVPVQKDTVITNRDVIHWSSFSVNPVPKNADRTVKRFGFMSRISPDGRYVITSIGPPSNTDKNGNVIPSFAPGLLDRLYSTNYKDFRFLQVFFPTRGILAYYDRNANKMATLPGADDPKYVQAGAFWSPDSKYLIFSRAVARDPYPPGAPKPEYANDPKEPQIQYDLYKIPFNDGKGGAAVPVEGASNNGMSNDFPKVSPDGRWIVFVENHNGLLMRPDSKLYIVPFGGGKARLMECNTSLMNSWHTFSPNGHWLAFSSKARSPYTQLMLTHIDENGNSTPAIMVENTTAANRAVNIPEFVNVQPGGFEKIDPQSTEFYRLVNQAFAFMEENKIPEAISKLRSALEKNPDDALEHYHMGTLLTMNKQDHEAVEEYRKACTLDPGNSAFLDHLGVSLASNGELEEATEKLQKAISIYPTTVEYRHLGFVLEARGDYAGAVVPLQKAVELSKGKDWICFAELAKAYVKTGQSTEAVQSAHQALDEAIREGNQQGAKNMQEFLDRYGAMAKPQ
jgi:Flp pilus assembly protein TadD